MEGPKWRTASLKCCNKQHPYEDRLGGCRVAHEKLKRRARCRHGMAGRHVAPLIDAWIPERLEPLIFDRGLLNRGREKRRRQSTSRQERRYKTEPLIKPFTIEALQQYAKRPSYYCILYIVYTSMYFMDGASWFIKPSTCRTSFTVPFGPGNFVGSVFRKMMYKIIGNW